MEHKDVFISYKSEEFDVANWVKSTLENNGISCWMAPMCIPGGSSYAKEIPRAIRNCKIFVLILSEKSQKSKWVPRELDQAINHNKIIMPFMLENCDLRDDFNFYLTNVQRYAAYESKVTAIEKMITEIKAILCIKDTVCKSDTSVQSESIVSKAEKEPRTSKLPELKKASRKIGKRKTALIISAPIISVVALAAVVLFIVNNLTTLQIAGEQINKNEPYISFYDKTFTVEDVDKLASLQNVTSFSFKNCVFPDDKIGSFIDDSTITGLTFKNCELTDNAIRSIDFSSLSLTSFDIEGNDKITDISALASNADSLTSLTISKTSVSDISFIRSFKSLYNLNAESTCVSGDISFENFSNLYDLNIKDNEISSLNLKGCGKLLKLIADDNKLSDLDLSDCKKIHYLSVNNNNLSDSDGLINCINLKEIYAGYNKLNSLSGLSNTTVLENVYLNHNNLSDVSVLAGSSDTLKRIYLSDNKITDCSSLSGCSSLEYFTADNNLLSSLDFLSDATALKGLSVSKNGITSVDGIKECKSLSYLNISDNALEHADALPSFNSQDGVALILNNNKISKLDIPAAKYNYLVLYGNTGMDFSLSRGCSGNKLIFDYSDSIDFASLKNTGFKTYHIIGCPLNRQLDIQECLGDHNTDFISAEKAKEISVFTPDAVKGVAQYYPE